MLSAATRAPAAQSLVHLADVADAYDACVLDLWGVVHDGVRMYPDAAQCLSALAEAGKRVVFLSNAPRRADAVQAVLDRLSVPRSHYEAIYSSGEVAHGWLLNGAHGLGSRCVFVGLETDLPVLDGLPLTRVDSPDEAEFVFCAGYDALFQNPDELNERLAAWQARGLPMLCINPDITVVRQDGSTIYCAGHLAQRYAAMGGAVTQVGKPYPLVYEAVKAHFATIPTARLLAVGDSMHTDIAGANAAGIACALITGGIHATDFASNPNILPTLSAQHHAMPDYVLPSFRW